jgi:hypothetical protein
MSYLGGLVKKISPMASQNNSRIYFSLKLTLLVARNRKNLSPNFTISNIINKFCGLKY